jgi:serine/threonine protein kinase
MELPQLLQHCRQILTLLSSLHSKGIVAGDLKPSNLLVSDRDKKQQQQQPQQQQQQQQQAAGYSSEQQMVVADSQLHVVMTQALGELWPSEAAVTEPWYK